MSIRPHVIPSHQTPVVTAMRIIPIAGHDSMLLNLSGAHAPFFTRNLVVLTDNAGNTGAGEVPGGEKIRQVLEESRPLVEGQGIAGLSTNPQRDQNPLRRPRHRRPRPPDLRSTHHHPRRNRRRIRTPRPPRPIPQPARRSSSWRRSAAPHRPRPRLPLLYRRPQQDRSPLRKPTQRVR